MRDPDKPFDLTGTRYADEIDFPPFHHYCQTASVLYHRAFDDGVTGRIREEARRVMDRRES